MDTLTKKETITLITCGILVVGMIVMLFYQTSKENKQMIKQLSITTTITAPITTPVTLLPGHSYIIEPDIIER
jgi:hypothetical protein